MWVLSIRWEMRFSLRYGRSEREVVVGVYVVGGGLRLDVDEGGVRLVILEQRFFGGYSYFLGISTIFIFKMAPKIDRGVSLKRNDSFDCFPYSYSERSYKKLM